MRSGELKHRLAVQDKTMVEDSQRRLTPSWSTSFYIRAKKVQESGSEDAINRAIQGTKVYLLTTRYHPSLSPDQRLIDGDETLEIIDINTVKPRRELLITVRQTSGE